MWNGHDPYGGRHPYGSPGAGSGYHTHPGVYHGQPTAGGGMIGQQHLLDAYSDASANAAAFAQAAQHALIEQPQAFGQASSDYDQLSMMAFAGYGNVPQVLDPYAASRYAAAMPARGKPEALAANALRQKDIAYQSSDAEHQAMRYGSQEQYAGTADEDESDDSGEEEEGMESPLQLQQQNQSQTNPWDYPPPADHLLAAASDDELSVESRLSVPRSDVSRVKSSDDSDDDKPIGTMGTQFPVVSKKSKAKPPTKSKTAPAKPQEKSFGKKAMPTKKSDQAKKPAAQTNFSEANGEPILDTQAMTPLVAEETDSLAAIGDSLAIAGQKKAAAGTTKTKPKAKPLNTAPKDPVTPKSATSARGSKTAVGALVLNPHPREKDSELPMTPAEQDNAKALIRQFCTLPLLAEFTKPLHVLHSELSELYLKVVTQPMDLSYICRRLNSGGYKYARHLQLDIWRMCSNCIVFHTDSRVQKANVAIPSFVNIALHLRDYFNALWEEYMVPSCEPYEENNPDKEDRDNYALGLNALRNGGDTSLTPGTTDGSSSCSSVNVDKSKLQDPTARFGYSCSVPYHPRIFERRAKNRRVRFRSAVQTPLSVKACHKAAKAIEYFMTNQGRVDALDPTPLIGNGALPEGDSLQIGAQMNQMKNWLVLCADALKAKLTQAINNSDEDDEEEDVASVQITIHELHQHFQAVLNLHCVVSRPKLQYELRHRLDRLLHKIIVPIYEAGCRGVNQSSIWGCMAAAIWARESSRKPYWPALVLGILAPEHQKEEWHKTLTERNEARLPEKLLQGLGAGKKKATLGIESKKKGEQMSYFMVEFLGKHQFQWVREADILEEFDPEQDPNDPAARITGADGKKRKINAHPMSDKAAFKTAVQECEWAVDEFDMQIRDPCGDLFAMDDEIIQEENDENGLPKYNYTILANTQPEQTDESKMEMETDEEGEELYATDGLLDVSAEGLRDRKARLLSAKKIKEASARKAKIEQLKKDKSEAARIKKERAEAAKMKKEESESDKAKLKDNKKTTKTTKKRKLSETEPPEEEEPEASEKRMRVRKGSIEKVQSPREDKKGKSPRKKSNLIDNKKERAKAKVKAYLTKLIQKGKLVAHAPTPTAGPGGSMEVGGLMGMAMAFRAAAGEIRGADPRDIAESRPWETMDVNSATSEQERCAILHTQIVLLEEELERMEMDQRKRESLIKIWSSVKNEFGQSLDGRIVEPDSSDELATSITKKAPKKKKSASLKKCPPAKDSTMQQDDKVKTITEQAIQSITVASNCNRNTAKENGESHPVAEVPLTGNVGKHDSTDNEDAAGGGSSVSDVNTEDGEEHELGGDEIEW